MKEILKKVFNNEILNSNEIEYTVEKILNKTYINEQIAALIGAITTRGVKPGELASFIKALKKYSIEPELKSNDGFIDVCGTGGDCLNTFNISTTVSFIVASSNVKVSKHGNRSISSSCGSADVMEELGISIIQPKEKLQNILDETNFLFFFAPEYNPQMSEIKKIRNSIGTPTIFNLLGPLINPVNLDYQIMGVYDKEKLYTIAKTLKELNLKEAMVIHSKGADELMLNDENIIYHLKDNKVKKIDLPPIDSLGLKYADVSELKGGDKKQNAQIILDILQGKEKGAKRDVVLLNSAAALVVSNKVKDFKEGIELSKELIDSKKALETLERIKNVS